MTLTRGLALDANILIRAALGKRVHALLKAYEDLVAFYTPVASTMPASTFHRYSAAGATTRKPVSRCSIRSGYSSSRGMNRYIGISGNSPGSEWSRATLKTGRLSPWPSC